MVYWLREVRIERDIVLQISVRIFVGDRKKDPAAVSSFQECPVNDDDPAAICHCILAGLADGDGEFALK